MSYCNLDLNRKRYVLCLSGNGPPLVATDRSMGFFPTIFNCQVNSQWSQTRKVNFVGLSHTNLHIYSEISTRAPIDFCSLGHCAAQVLLSLLKYMVQICPWRILDRKLLNTEGLKPVQKITNERGTSPKKGTGASERTLWSRAISSGWDSLKRSKLWWKTWHTR